MIGYAQGVVNEARFPVAVAWTRAIELGDPYALVTVLISQFGGLKSLRLDYSFVWIRGYPGIMVRHALFSAPRGVLSSFDALELVDYGGNVRLAAQGRDSRGPGTSRRLLILLPAAVRRVLLSPRAQVAEYLAAESGRVYRCTGRTGGFNATNQPTSIRNAPLPPINHQGGKTAVVTRPHNRAENALPRLRVPIGR